MEKSDIEHLMSSGCSVCRDIGLRELARSGKRRLTDTNAGFMLYLVVCFLLGLAFGRMLGRMLFNSDAGVDLWTASCVLLSAIFTVVGRWRV